MHPCTVKPKSFVLSLPWKPGMAMALALSGGLGIIHRPGSAQLGGLEMFGSQETL